MNRQPYLYRLLCIFVITGMMFCVTGDAQAQISTDELLAYYSFDGNADDSSGNGGPNGTVTGPTLTLGADGRVDGAYLFDGVDDYIEFGNTFNELTVPFSIAFWVRQDGTGQFSGVFFSDDWNAGYAGVRISLSGSHLDVSFGDGGGSVVSSNRRSFLIGAAAPEGVWTHIICVVRSGLDMSVYVNGSDESSSGEYSGTGGPMVTNSLPARIGVNSAAYGSPGRGYFRGALDEFYIYNRALDPSEIPPLTVPVTTTSWGEVKSLFR